MGLASQNFSSDVILTEESVRRVLGARADGFIACMRLAEAIAANPGDYPGVKASRAALQLAAERVNIGLLCQVQKSAPKGEEQRLQKDLLFTMYHSLEELINTLKLFSRFEMDASR